MIHDFDCSNLRSKLSSSSTFTKFLVLPETRPFLPLRFKPAWTSTPRPSTPTPSSSNHLSQQARPNRISRYSLLPYLPLLFFFLILLPAIFLPLSPPSQPPIRDTNLSPSATISSYSTTITMTQTVVSTTTQVQTITQTYLQIPSFTPLPTTSTTTSIPLESPPSPVRTIALKSQDYSISSETGNVVLVWLEQLRANVRTYWEGLWRWLQTVA